MYLKIAVIHFIGFLRRKIRIEENGPGGVV
jgi:hypothetical protein